MKSMKKLKICRYIDEEHEAIKEQYTKPQENLKHNKNKQINTQNIKKDKYKSKSNI